MVELWRFFMSTKIGIFCLAALAASLCACMGPVALTKALPDYDETINTLDGQSLLLNIARGRHFMPPHFTNTTSIVATFNFRTDASIGGQFSSDPGNAYGSASLGATIEENPTIELSPLRGEQFAEQMLTPLTDDQFRLLVTEKVPLDMLIRLVGKSFHFEDARGVLTRSVRNRPDIPAEYEEYRQIAAHIAALSASNQLFARQVSFVDTTELELAKPPDATDFLEARKSGFELTTNGQNMYAISQRVVGNTIVTNFDTMILSNEERHQLNNRISLTPSNYVDVNIRPNFPGGDFPLIGVIQLRSFHEILNFIARGIEESPEYPVELDPRTLQLTGPPSQHSTAQSNQHGVLTIVESSKAPPDEVLQVRYRGSYYHVRQSTSDLAAFQALYLLLQMSGQSSTERAFPITIAR